MTHCAPEWSPREGGCECGAIRFRLSAPPLFVHACHCHGCQRATGSAFILSMFVCVEDFQLSHGEPALTEVPGGSGEMRQSYHCMACGSLVFGTIRQRERVLRPGCFDQTDWFMVGAHIWTESKQPWLTLPDNALAFPQSYARENVWPAEALARLVQQ